MYMLISNHKIMFDPHDNHVQQVEDKSLSPSPWTIPNWTIPIMDYPKVDYAVEV